MPVTLKTMSMKYRENDTDSWSPALVQAKAELEPAIEEIAETASEVGIVITGKRPSKAVSKGQYVIVRDSTITGITDGLYTAKNALTTSADVTASDLNSKIDAGGLNDLKNTLIKFKTVDFTWTPPGVGNMVLVPDIVTDIVPTKIISAVVASGSTNACASIGDISVGGKFFIWVTQGQGIGSSSVTGHIYVRYLE